MPLYLVRWPTLQASLVRAHNETELMDRIDEIATPGDCSWVKYDGPLWIDLEVPVEYSIDEKHPGRLRADEVIVGELPEGLDEQPLRMLPIATVGGETAAEMTNALLLDGFPLLAAELASLEDDREPDPRRLRDAVLHELLEHDKRTRYGGVTLTAEMRLIRTSTWVFARRGRVFHEIPAALLEDFCHGLATIPPDEEGLVRVAEVCVHWSKGRPVHAEPPTGLRLRASQDGRILQVHRTDAFGDVGEHVTEGARRFADRRNKNVRWSLERPDVAALRKAVNAKAGAPIFAGTTDRSRR